MATLPQDANKLTNDLLNIVRMSDELATAIIKGDAKLMASALSIAREVYELRRQHGQKILDTGADS